MAKNAFEHKYSSQEILNRVFDDTNNTLALDGASSSGVLLTVGSSGATYTTDGVNDETEINLAIVAANAAGGGVVYLKQGTYQVQSTTINMKSNVELTGDPGSNIIFADSLWVLCSENTNFSIHGLNFDTRTHQTGADFVLKQAIKVINCSKARIYNNNIECYAFGIFFISDDAVGSGNDAEKSWIYNNYIRGNCHNDLIGGGENDLTSICRDLVIKNNHLIQDTTLSGAGGASEVINLVPMSNIIVDGNVCEGRIKLGNEKDPHYMTMVVNNTVRPPHGSTTVAGAIVVADNYPTTHLNTSSHIIVANNTVEGGPIQIFGKSADRMIKVSVLGNSVKNSTTATDSSGYPQHGIHLQYCDSSIVQGNLLDANSVTGTVGIYLDNASTNYIGPNTVNGYVTGIDKTGTSDNNDIFAVQLNNCTTNIGSTITSSTLTTLLTLNNTKVIRLGNEPSAALVSTVGAKALVSSSPSTIQLGLEGTTASGSGAGAGFGVYSNDGAAMASGDRLGFLLFGGASSASALRNTAGVFSYASEAWTDASAYGTDLVFETTAPTTTTRSEKFRIKGLGNITVPTTVTAGGTTGNQTINKVSGTVNIAAAGTTVTVTNSLVASTSIVLAVIRTADSTARISNVVPGSGSFVINIVACAAEVSIGFLVIN